MRLTTEQIERYHVTLTSLVSYADVRLGLTQRLPPHEEERLSRERTALVTRELWRRLDLVEGFVRDNPDGLATSHIEMARLWRDGIYCHCAVTSRDDDGGLWLETDAGTFVVQDVGYDFGSVAPVAFRTALLPFDGGIVMGVPVDMARICEEDEVAWLRKRSAKLGLAGVAVTSDDLLARSVVAAKARLGRELERPDVSGRVAPAAVAHGFHRGVLAGLSFDERMNACDRHLRGEDGRSGSSGGDLPDQPFAQGGPDGEQDGAEEVVRVVGACALLYGVVALADVHDQYVAMSLAPLSRGDFVSVVRENAGALSCGYDLWKHEGVTYVVAPSLSGLGALDGMLDVLACQGEEGERKRKPFARGNSSPLDESGLAELDALAREECERLQKLRVRLVDLQAGVPRRPLERRMVEQGIMRYLLRLDVVCALRDFVDAHVPDGEDDYLFADLLVTEVMGLLMPGAKDAETAYDLLVACGMMRCEGTSWSDTLGRMVVNVYNALPRWERNGWSFRQLRERLTGRREFYALDGSVMRVGRGDPCPCGSGRSYGRCCGR